MTYTHIWIRVAGHAQRIRDGEANHWRVYPHRAPEELPVARWEVEGTVSPENLVPGTDPAAANPMHLTAWIDVYGDMTVEDGVARITLHEPHKE